MFLLSYDISFDSVFADSVYTSEQASSGRLRLNLDQGLAEKFQEKCPKDCAYTRYILMYFYLSEFFWISIFPSL